MLRHLVAALLLAPLLLASPALAADGPAFDAARALGRGVNLGNALEASKEGEWGFRIRPEYLPLIKKAGFSHVRVPVKWSAHAGKDRPYPIEEAFAARVDEVIDQALKAGLRVVLNVHHYDEIMKRPAEHRDRLIALWAQIAPRYKDRGDELVFEVLNEPHDKLDAKTWNGVVRDALAVIRKASPKRAVIVGPVSWNNLNHLDSLDLPGGDDRLIATFHYYSPFEFTHQGASWSKGSEKWLGRKWTGSAAEQRAVVADLGKAAAWGEKHGRPLYLGEFGAYEKADLGSRAKWTRFIREQAEKRGFAWAYWEFGAGFGAYDPAAKKWREPLREALVGRPE